MQPLVSVLITCLNCEKFLQHAIDCTLSQTYENIECIIVDDGSTDNTREIAASIIKKHPQIKYIVNTDIHGVSGIRNFGIKHALGEWIQIYDVDDHLYPDKIKKQIDALNENNIDPDQEVVVYSDFEVAWENTDGVVVRTMNNTVGKHSRDVLLNKMLSWTGGPTMPFQVNTILFKRSLFTSKLFNEDLIGFEDIDMFTYLLHKNIPFIYAPTLAMTYRLHDSNVTRDHRRSIIGYIQFLWEAYKQDPELLRPTSARINIIIDLALRKRDSEIIEKIITLVKRTKIPFHATWKGINVKNLFVLRLILYRRKPLEFIKSFFKPRNKI